MSEVMDRHYTDFIPKNGGNYIRKGSKGFRFFPLAGDARLRNPHPIKTQNITLNLFINQIYEINYKNSITLHKIKNYVKIK